MQSRQVESNTSMNKKTSQTHYTYRNLLDNLCKMDRTIWWMVNGMHARIPCWKVTKRLCIVCVLVQADFHYYHLLSTCSTQYNVRVFYFLINHSESQIANAVQCTYTHSRTTPGKPIFIESTKATTCSQSKQNLASFRCLCCCCLQTIQIDFVPAFPNCTLFEHDKIITESAPWLTILLSMFISCVWHWLQFNRKIEHISSIRRTWNAWNDNNVLSFDKYVQVLSNTHVLVPKFCALSHAKFTDNAVFSPKFNDGWCETVQRTNSCYCIVPCSVCFAYACAHFTIHHKVNKRKMERKPEKSVDR